MHTVEVIKNHTAETMAAELSKKASEHLVDPALAFHFSCRGLEVVDFDADTFPLLSQVVPHLIVGASAEYRASILVPYQETSFVVASSRLNGEPVFIFRIPGEEDGGISRITAGYTAELDRLMVMLQRATVGARANIVSVDNLLAHPHEVWRSEQFFKDDRPFTALQNEILKLREARRGTDRPTHIIVGRSPRSMEALALAWHTLRIVEEKIPIVILTSLEGARQLAVAGFRETENAHVVAVGRTPDEFSNRTALGLVRRNFGITMALNDGGMRMVRAMEDDYLIGAHRVTVAPPNPNLPQRIEDANAVFASGEKFAADAWHFTAWHLRMPHITLPSAYETFSLILRQIL